MYGFSANPPTPSQLVTYAGPVAKAAVLAQATGAGGAASFGGVDLISRLESRVAGAAPVAGRISDATTFDDYANTLGQAFAARALMSAGSTKASTVTSFLLKQQCSDGYFRQSSRPQDGPQPVVCQWERHPVA